MFPPGVGELEQTKKLNFGAAYVEGRNATVGGATVQKSSRNMTARSVGNVLDDPRPSLLLSWHAAHPVFTDAHIPSCLPNLFTLLHSLISVNFHPLALNISTPERLTRE